VWRGLSARVARVGATVRARECALPRRHPPPHGGTRRARRKHDTPWTPEASIPAQHRARGRVLAHQSICLSLLPDTATKGMMWKMTSVLAIDTDPGFRALAARMLGEAGLSVVGQADGFESGRAAVAELRPDVMLVDVMLGDSDGVALDRKLAALPWKPRVLPASGRRRPSATTRCPPMAWSGSCPSWSCRSAR